MILIPESGCTVVKSQSHLGDAGQDRPGAGRSRGGPVAASTAPATAFIKYLIVMGAFNHYADCASEYRPPRVRSWNPMVARWGMVRGS